MHYISFFFLINSYNFHKICIKNQSFPKLHEIICRCGGVDILQAKENKVTIQTGSILECSNIRASRRTQSGYTSALHTQCSEADQHERELEAIRSLQEQARHHLGSVGGLVGEKEHEGICYESTDCKEGWHPCFADKLLHLCCKTAL